MKKMSIKSIYKFMGTAVVASAMLLTFVVVKDNKKEEDVIKDTGNYEYVNNSISTNNVPVVTEEKVIIKPYTSEKVEISKKFYDKDSSDKDKEDALIYYKDTYMQNSGVLYNSDNEFMVVSVLDGEVIDLKKDDILGYVVEVKHDNNLISIYQGLKSVNVKKGDQITQNSIIGKSGEITLDVNLKNALLFELIKDGKYVNPEIFYNKKIKEI